MNKKTQFVVPIDYTTNAHNALKYAEGLAKTIDAFITVVHVKEYIIPNTEIIYTPYIDIDDVSLKKAVEDFISSDDKPDSWLANKDNVKIEILEGYPVTAIINLSEDKANDLIIMSSGGLQDMLSKVISSTSVKVAEAAHCPVIIVPTDCLWFPIKRIMYASNYTSLTPLMIQKILNFAFFVNAEIHFVHIENENKQVENKEMAAINWSKLFSLDAPRIAYRTYSIQGNDIIVKLKKYARENDIDMMVFTSRKRGFWENLTQKSVIYEMAAHAQLPMMVMHLE